MERRRLSGLGVFQKTDRANRQSCRTRISSPPDAEVHESKTTGEWDYARNRYCHPVLWLQIPYFHRPEVHGKRSMPLLVTASDCGRGCSIEAIRRWCLGRHSVSHQRRSLRLTKIIWFSMRWSATRSLSEHVGKRGPNDSSVRQSVASRLFSVSSQNLNQIFLSKSMVLNLSNQCNRSCPDRWGLL